MAGSAVQGRRESGERAERERKGEGVGDGERAERKLQTMQTTCRQAGEKVA